MKQALGRSLIGVALAAVLPAAALGNDTCNGLIEISYPGAPPVQNIGDVVRMRISLGTGSIQGGTKLTVRSFQVNLDCDASFPLTPPCTDEGALVEFEGNVTSTCPVAVGTTHAVSPNPNEVIFVFAGAGLDIPANQSTLPGFCSVEFDVQVLAASLDGTAVIEQLVGYDIADCDNGVLVSGGFQTADLPVPTTTTTTVTTTSTTTTSTTTTTTTTTSTTTTTVALFTRTPGFWKNRPEIALVVLTNAGGLTVCGQQIINVAIDDARSAVEAMCVDVEGVKKRQLARQLMAASLNVAAGGAPFPLLAACNAVCADPAATDDAVTDCIDDTDDYNNSGDNVDLPFDPGSANSGPCKQAKNNDCFIIDPPSCAAP